jgi:hypothetical protein
VGRDEDLRKAEIIRLLEHKKQAELSFDRAYESLKKNTCSDSKVIMDNAMGRIIKVNRDLIEMGHLDFN